jgi:hypothetical protein
MDHRDAILALIQGKATTDPVTLPVAWLQSLLTDDATTVAVDLSGTEVARLLGRSPVTIAGWCRAGLCPGAYRLRGREWRIPRSGLEALQALERSGGMAA